MKTINVTFEDSEFEKLLKIKNDYSWQVFILKAAEAYEKEEK